MMEKFPLLINYSIAVMFEMIVCCKIENKVHVLSDYPQPKGGGDIVLVLFICPRFIRPSP